MKTFSILEAAGEPFRMITRRPLAMTAWGLLLLLPVAGTLALMVPFFAELAEAGAFDPDAMTEPAMFGDDFAAMMQFQAWSQLLNLVQMLSVLLVTTAVIRATYAGRRGDRAAFLRIGMDELQVAVVGIAIGVGVTVLAVVAVLLAVGVGAALWTVAEPWRAVSYGVMGLALVLGFVLLWGRLALLAPACLHYKTFAFVEGWRLGRGQTGRLFGLMLVLILIAILIGAAVLLVIVAIGLAAGGGVHAPGDPEAIEAWFESLPERPGLLIAGGAILLLPMAFLQGFTQTLMTAPYAFAVRALAGQTTPTAQAAPDPGPNAPDAPRADGLDTTLKGMERFQ